MKGRQWISAFLILVIIGGLGYVGWTLLPNFGHAPNGHNSTPNPSHNMDMGSNSHQGNIMPMPQVNPQIKSTIALRNTEQLGAALALINQAIELITIDPYSRTTVPNPELYHWMSNRTNPSSRTSGITVFPNGNSSVNIYPNGKTENNSSNDGFLNSSANTNFVFDQNKLYQLHQKIFMLAQGVMAVQDLNGDLTFQASQLETSPPDYPTLVRRYNQAYQNKVKLDSALRIFQDSFGLINLNPYAPPEGYQFNIQNMDSLHQGIYKLSQGLTQLHQLNKSFEMQMNDAMIQAQMLNMRPMNMIHSTPNPLSYQNILLMVTAVFIIILILVIVARILRAANPPQLKED